MEGLEKTKYVDDSAVTDHYAIIPTGQTQEEAGLGKLERDVYYLICAGSSASFSLLRI